MIRGTGIDSTVKLYLKGNGANGSTKFFDDSQTHRTITAVGTAAISNAQSKFGGSSMLLSGDGNYISFPMTGITIGTGDFSLCGWIYPTSLPTAGWITGVGTRLFDIRYDPGGNGLSFADDGTNMKGSRVSNMSTDTWQYICITRASNVLKMYLGGSQQGGNFTDNSDIDLSTYSGRLGGAAEGSGFNLPGYYDDWIIIVGHAIDGTKVPTRQRG